MHEPDSELQKPPNLLKICLILQQALDEPIIYYLSTRELARGHRAGCGAHFGLLTSDNTLRLYSTADLLLPEQRFELQLHPGRFTLLWK